MVAKIIGILSGFIIATISTLGYSGIVLLMAIESACIPLPSEIIMPFSGYLVFKGEMNLWLVGLAGAVGCVLGSLVAYWAGMYGGRPFIVAKMTELLELDGNSRVLEIGAGSGYQTAVLSQIAAQVYSIERIGDLAREAQSRIRALGIYNATVKCFDGTLGWAANAPYDAILVAAGGPTIPEPLIAQLKLGGRLVVPVGDSRESQRLIRVIKTDRGPREEDHGGCAFVPLIGQHGWSDR